jgi:hypothetical protein
MPGIGSGLHEAESTLLEHVFLHKPCAIIGCMLIYLLVMIPLVVMSISHGAIASPDRYRG